MKMGTVYKLTFPDGKSYIGSTIRSLKKRLQDHKSKAPSRCSRIANAIFLTGMDNILVEVLCNEEDISILRKTESQLIKDHETLHPNGYNTSFGVGFQGVECIGGASANRYQHS